MSIQNIDELILSAKEFKKITDSFKLCHIGDWCAAETTCQNKYFFIKEGQRRLIKYKKILENISDDEKINNAIKILCDTIEDILDFFIVDLELKLPHYEEMTRTLRQVIRPEHEHYMKQTYGIK